MTIFCAILLFTYLYIFWIYKRSNESEKTVMATIGVERLSQQLRECVSVCRTSKDCCWSTYFSFSIVGFSTVELFNAVYCVCWVPFVRRTLQKVYCTFNCTSYQWDWDTGCCCWCNQTSRSTFAHNILFLYFPLSWSFGLSISTGDYYYQLVCRKV